MTSSPITDPSTRTSKVVLITGASSGIGEATARQLAMRGHRIVLGARRTDRISAIVQDIERAGGQAFFQELDVARLVQVSHRNLVGAE